MRQSCSSKEDDPQGFTVMALGMKAALAGDCSGLLRNQPAVGVEKAADPSEPRISYSVKEILNLFVAYFFLCGSKLFLLTI